MGPQLLRVMNFNVSSDGIGAGPDQDQSLDRPFGLDSPERLTRHGASGPTIPSGGSGPRKRSSHCRVSCGRSGPQGDGQGPSPW